MPGREIEVPKELREFMLSDAEETVLGYRNGAKKQYRYGNLHIREYDDKFLLHTDRVDPRKDALGHLIHDAPEVLVGLGCAALCTARAGKKQNTTPSKILLPVIAGYLGYATTKKIKDCLEKRHDSN
ncbi:MAG: hypothetical protein OXC46_05130 [Thaumarchaeota archaeon]|nr:hypothetical protein [Nitrososphaerota archaeon]